MKSNANMGSGSSKSIKNEKNETNGQDDDASSTTQNVETENETTENRNVETIEQSDNCIDNFVSKLKESCDFFSENPKSMNWANEKGKNIADAVRLASTVFKNKFLNNKNRKKIGEIASKSDLIQFYFNYLKYIKTNYPEVIEVDEHVFKDIEKDTDNEHLLIIQHIVCSIVAFFVNNADICHEFCGICVNVGVVDILLEYLEMFQQVCNEEDKKDIGFKDLRENRRMLTINRVFSFHHNISRYNDKVMIERNAIDILIVFINCPNELFAMKSLLVLSYLIGEDNSHLVCSTQGPLKLYLNHVNMALTSKNNKCNGFQLLELLQGLAMIAQNDSNKIQIAQNGGVEILAAAIKNLAGDETEESQNILASIYHCLYLLSFHEENKEYMMKNETIADSLKCSAPSNHSNINKYKAGIKWELKGKQMQMMKREKEIEDTGMVVRKVDGEETKTGHIMISYQWSHQDIMLKVRDNLQANGFNVWLDLDDMQGSTLEAMANAVENAYVILMTVSSEYKASTNCRSEAEYAFQLKKPIIPLMMQTDYQADGWLGFIVGSKLWIDFKDKTNISKSLVDLNNEIVRRGFSQNDRKRVRADNPAIEQPSGQSRENNDIKRNKISQWSTDDIQSWLHSNDLDGMVSDDVINKHLDGEVLLHLMDLRLESPETFFKLLRKELEFDSLKKLFKFAECIQNLLDGYNEN